MMEKRNSTGILGTGWYVPEKVITNADLEKMVDTNNEWIVERTGIHERHVAAENQPASDLAERAARMALEDAHVKAEDLDLIIVATMTPDRIIPATACILQDRLGAGRAGAFDFSAACSGFAYAAAVACQFIETGAYRHILVVGAETLSKVIDWTDRSTCILFGDGAGAAVFGPVEAGLGLQSFDLGSDGAGGDLLEIPAGGSLHPLTAEALLTHGNCIQMDGRAVFRFAVKVLGETVEKSLAKAGLSKKNLDWLVPHQANTRIIDAAAKRLELPAEKIIVDIEKYGNMSAASIPVALAEAAHEHRFKKGDLVALAGFGAGLTWASCIMKWAKED